MGRGRANGTTTSHDRAEARPTDATDGQPLGRESSVARLTSPTFNKGGSERGRPGAPPYRPDPNQYSIPWTTGMDAARTRTSRQLGHRRSACFFRREANLDEDPRAFQEDHDNMEQFLGDCNTYFEVF